MATGERWLKPREAAAQLGVTGETLRRWADAGSIDHRRNHAGHREYPQSAVRALLDRMDAGGES